MNPFTDQQFGKFQQLIYSNFGITFHMAKKDMLQSKLDKLLRKYQLDSYDGYYQRLTKYRNPDDWTAFSDVITVNKTDFFRENNHFDFIRNKLDLITDKNPRILKNKELRAWSAGCSTGEEPYTLAMVLRECLPAQIKLKILATDISHRVMAIAQKGVYSPEIRQAIEPNYLHRYFHKNATSYEVIPEIKELVTFRLFNLMEPFPFRNTLDMIFCRNVMIYFDTQTQEELINKFYEVLTPGGLLLIGHSETLTNKKHRYQYIQPTVYVK